MTDRPSPPNNCPTLSAYLGDVEVEIEYEYSAGEPSRTYGPPEDCYEGEPDEAIVHSVLIQNVWVEASAFSDSQISIWHTCVFEEIERLRDNDQADRAEALARDRYEL